MKAYHFGVGFRLPARQRFRVPLLHPRRWRRLRPVLVVLAVGVLCLLELWRRREGAEPFYIERLR